MDFSHLGDFLLYLLYSSFEVINKKEKSPWYDELPLRKNQTIFLKKLFGIEGKYKNIDEVYYDFIKEFKTI